MKLILFSMKICIKLHRSSRLWELRERRWIKRKVKNLLEEKLVFCFHFYVKRQFLNGGAGSPQSWQRDHYAYWGSITFLYSHPDLRVFWEVGRWRETSLILSLLDLINYYQIYNLYYNFNRYDYYIF